MDGYWITSRIGFASDIRILDFSQIRKRGDKCDKDGPTWVVKRRGK